MAAAAVLPRRAGWALPGTGGAARGRPRPSRPPVQRPWRRRGSCSARRLAGCRGGPHVADSRRPGCRPSEHACDPRRRRRCIAGASAHRAAPVGALAEPSTGPRPPPSHRLSPCLGACLERKAARNRATAPWQVRGCSDSVLQLRERCRGGAKVRPLARPHPPSTDPPPAPAPAPHRMATSEALRPLRAAAADRRRRGPPQRCWGTPCAAGLGLARPHAAARAAAVRGR